MIRIRNIGPIKEANIELADKTVIVGSNGSGKTFLSTLIYFLISPIPFPEFSVFSLLHAPTISKFLDIKPGEETYEISFKDILEVKEIKDVFINYLKDIFNVNNLAELVSIGEKEGIIEDERYKIIITTDSKEPLIEGKEYKEEIRIRWDKKEDTECISSITSDGRILVIGKHTFCASSSISIKIITELISLKDWYPEAFISTERVALFNLLPAVYNLAFSPTRVLPIKTLTFDFLRYILPGEEEYKGLTFRFDQKEGMKVYKGKRRISPSLVSTGYFQVIAVKFLADNPYLKSLIIEEPEINLHAGERIEFARELSSLNKKLIITTHDEWTAMVIAHESKRKKFKAKVYEIVDGKLEERKIYKDGTLEKLKTIFSEYDKKFFKYYFKSVLK